ncbi:MAG: hypothetical protein GY810_17670 [Aureispira sp.]|nr:hypothetical protein [Aureispira sp.]
MKAPILNRLLILCSLLLIGQLTFAQGSLIGLGEALANGVRQIFFGVIIFVLVIAKFIDVMKDDAK